jgi:D-glycero-D-manno-heptose 1,7-bisphosphate phosphatase
MKIIFLDRDGVINRYPGDKKYVTRIKDFHLLPGVLAALKKLTEQRFKISVISNQAGVSKGVYSRDKLDAITNVMLKKIEKAGAKLDGVFYCIHRKEENCACRKPGTGLIKKAMGGRKVKVSDSAYFIGDTIIDMQAGKRAGLKTILVFSGKEKQRNQSLWEVRPDFVAKDLLAATKIILNENPGHIRHCRKRPQKVR